MKTASEKTEVELILEKYRNVRVGDETWCEAYRGLFGCEPTEQAFAHFRKVQAANDRAASPRRRPRT